MDIFGAAWEDHQTMIGANWDDRVADGDVVLVPGDFSWAMKEEQVSVDLAWLEARPGQKVLIKGNHDYWWPKTRIKLDRLLPAGIHSIKKNAVLLDGLGFFGVRGGDFAPLTRYGDARSQDQVDATLDKEERELRASIDDLVRLEAEHGPARMRVCLCHYPPIPSGHQGGRFASLITAAGARYCIYGHLHGPDGSPERVEGDFDGVVYRCVSCDLVGFAPVLIHG